jgi:photosystem II stability/assembly factor-like uncharacterized protein
MSATVAFYAAAPVAGKPNVFKTGDTGATWTSSTASTIGGDRRDLQATRIQPQVGMMLASWDPGPLGGTPNALALSGSNTFAASNVANASGQARSFAGSGATDLFVAVWGKTPAGAAATGGIFHSIDKTITWTELDTGVSAADVPRIWTIVSDPGSPMVLYAGLRGGGQIYKTVDQGVSWTQKNSGMAPGIEVLALAVSPQDGQLVYAGTSSGLYKSADAGDTWAIAGFPNRSVRAVAISPVDANVVLVGVADSTGLYKPQ